MVHTLFYLNPFSISNISFSIDVLPQQQSFSICLSIYLFIHSSSLSALMDQDSLLFFSSSEVIQIAESGWSSADTLDKLLIYLFPPPSPSMQKPDPCRWWDSGREAKHPSLSEGIQGLLHRQPQQDCLPTACMLLVLLQPAFLAHVSWWFLLPFCCPPPLLFRAMFAYAGGEGSSSVI